MPTHEELDAMALLLFGETFAAASYENGRAARCTIVELALAAKRNDLLAAIQNDTDTVAQVLWGK